MFERLKELLKSRGGSDDPLVEAHMPAFAAAMLLLEVAWADHDITAHELAAACRGIAHLFGMSSDEAQEIVAKARHEHASSTSLHPFTRSLNERLSAVEKRELVSLLWRLAYTDAVLTGYEEHAIRGIADLLHMSHGDFIAAKQQGRGAAQLSGKPPRAS